jgi:hypothetical protein
LFSCLFQHPFTQFWVSNHRKICLKAIKEVAKQPISGPVAGSAV